MHTSATVMFQFQFVIIILLLCYYKSFTSTVKTSHPAIDFLQQFPLDGDSVLRKPIWPFFSLFFFDGATKENREKNYLRITGFSLR